MPAILRFGFITPQVIEQIIDKHVEIAMKSSTIKAPGMMYAHYAPKTSIRINAISLEEGEVGLNFGDSKLNAKGSLNLSPSGDLAIAAANLFDYLHRLDDYARANFLQRIAIAPIPNESIGLAINDRLIKATLSK
jgi:L-threonylcarbamoyladenylate synthase